MKKLIWVLVLMAIAVQVKAEVPKLINYSGKLTDKQGNVLENKIYDIRFSLWTAQTGGAEVWSEEHYNAQGRGVQTYGGGFNLVLGGTTPLPAFEQNYWIQIRINIKGTDETFARQEIISVPYAMRAEYANYGIPKGGIIIWRGATCPVGYSRVTDLNGRFPKGATGNPGAAGGSTSHSHTGSIGDTNIDHTHNVNGTTSHHGHEWDAGYGSHTAIAGHSHTFNVTSGAMSANKTHSHSLTLNNAVNLWPPYLDVIFCEKD